MITTLTINDIACHSFHGCLKEETTIGQRYSVDVIITADFTVAVKTDQLDHAADYVIIHQLVQEEMLMPSRLIEHAAGRILNRISSLYLNTKNITVTIKKFNPPVNGHIGAAIFTISLN